MRSDIMMTSLTQYRLGKCSNAAHSFLEFDGKQSESLIKLALFGSQNLTYANIIMQNQFI